MRPLPEEPFEAGRWLTPRVDRFAQVTVRTNKYSVPVRLIGRRVRVLLHASDLVIYDGRAEAARHERLPGESGTHLDLDHYLEALVRKPGALPGSTALEQARAAGKFTPVHDAWWAAARKAHGDAAGTRALVEVLLHRHMDSEHVVAGLAAALRAGALTADAVALEARKAADEADGQPTADDTPSAPLAVASLTARRLERLPPDTRPLPSVAAYDQLLRRNRTHGKEPPAHDRQAPPWTDRAGRRRRRRPGLPDAAPADNPRPVPPSWPRPPPASRCPTVASLPNCSWPSATTAPAAAPNAASRQPGSPGRNRCAPSTSTPTRASTPPSSTPSPPATGSRKGSRSA